VPPVTGSVSTGYILPGEGSPSVKEKKPLLGIQDKGFESVKVCTGVVGGPANCIKAKEIEIDPKTGERVVEAVPAPTLIEVELNIEEKKEKIKITRSGNKAIEVEDSEGKKFKTSEPIKVSEGGLRVKEKPVKVLPGKAIKTVKKRLKSITLKEVELKVVQETPVYEITAIQKATFLWVIPVKMKVKATVNAQTNGIESIEKPWWSFLVG
jgi:uncharacterized membrane protein YkoI